MSPSQTTIRTLFVVLAVLLTGSNAFSVVPTRNYHVATPTPTALHVFQRSSPSKSSVSFLRGDRPSNKKRRSRQGHADASAEGDPPAPHGIEHKGEDPETKNANQPAKKKGYQRVEEWDAEQKAGGMTWEQKVQFDGLRMGNGVRQNEILQRHLGSF